MAALMVHKEEGVIRGRWQRSSQISYDKQSLVCNNPEILSVKGICLHLCVCVTILN